MSFRAARLCGLVVVGMAVPRLTSVRAQSPLVASRTASIGPTFERWSFGRGLRQPAIDGSGTVELSSATAWSIPVAASIGLGSRWTFDVSTAYANGTVELATPDVSLGRDEYALSGLTDIHTRLTGRLLGDNLVATVGFNVPTGTTELDAAQFAALRVLGAPALAMQTPALGTGAGGTAGLVFARQLASWAWALGASYELRRSYTPIAFATGAAAPDVDPGDALHFTLGADGLVGENGMTIALTADVFSTDQLEPTAAGTPASAVSTKLGPIYAVDWQLRVATARLRELMLYAVDRYRSAYERDGRHVAESSGNYLDAGVRAVFPVSPSVGLSSALNLRHQTGLKSDSTLATAATAGAGVTLGIIKAFGSGYSVQPFLRGDFATIKNVATSVRATGLSAGVSLGRRF